MNPAPSSSCTISGNTAETLVGTCTTLPQESGGIFNHGKLTVKNFSSITGNASDDVYNLGVLYLDSTSTIGVFDGNPAIPI